MIVTEYYATRSDGVVLHRAYSDAGMMIERDGALYTEAIDPASLGRTYTETDIPCEDEATEADYIAALNDLGVDLNEEK